MGIFVRNSFVIKILQNHKISMSDVSHALTYCELYDLECPSISLDEALANYEISLTYQKRAIAIKQIYQHYLEKCGQKEF